MRRVATAVALAVLLAGCGEPAHVATPAEDVPALGEQLEALDALVVDQQWAQARAAAREIIVLANDAREAGDLPAAAADRVVASAQRLLTALPAAPAPTATPSATTPSTSSPAAGTGKPGKGGKKHGKKGR